MPEHLALVACGAPLAARLHDVAALAVETGWLVRVVATPSAMSWVDAGQVEKVTGFPVLVEQRQPGQAKRFPPPAQVIVCPATFNTVNKLAAGIMDNYAAGLLCEALASQIPLTVAPMVSNRLWPHPAWQHNLDMLTAAGVTFIDIQPAAPADQPPSSPAPAGTSSPHSTPPGCSPAGQPAQKS